MRSFKLCPSQMKNRFLGKCCYKNVLLPDDIDFETSLTLPRCVRTVSKLDSVQCALNMLLYRCALVTIL